MSTASQALARTYSDREYPDPWETVLDHRRVQEYAADRPKHGRIRVGNALGLPPNRVRAWLDGGMPDSVRGIQAAIDHGWFDPDSDSETTAGPVELLAHVLAGGHIAIDAFVPAVATARGSNQTRSGRRSIALMSSHSFGTVTQTDALPK